MVIPRNNQGVKQGTYMIIDHSEISKEALKSICREYVISNINEQDSELSIDIWAENVLSQVKSGELLIEFSEVEESVSLKKADEIVIAD